MAENENWLADGHEVDSDKDYSGRFVLRIPSDLHRRLEASANANNATLNAYITMLLARRDAEARSTAAYRFITIYLSEKNDYGRRYLARLLRQKGAYFKRTGRGNGNDPVFGDELYAAADKIMAADKTMADGDENVERIIDDAVALIEKYALCLSNQEDYNCGLHTGQPSSPRV